jgi:hypothetical protein
MVKYYLRILDGTSKGYTEQVICEKLDVGKHIYYFEKKENGISKVIAYYPIDRTIIEKIEIL